MLDWGRTEKPNYHMKTTLLLVTLLLALSFNSFAQGDAPEPPDTQPDLILAKGDRIVGNDIYGSPLGQVLRLRTIGARPVSFAIGLQNDSEIDDRIRIRASRRDRKFLVAYFKNGHNVTARLTHGTLVPLAAGESARFTARVRATRLTKGRNARKAIRVAAVSSLNRDRKDNALALIYKKKKRDAN